MTGLNPGTKYFYRAWAENSAGLSNGNALSVRPMFDWPLQSVSEGRFPDLTGKADGILGGDVSIFNDPARGNVARFDGDDDFITFGDLDEMDTPNRFTVSLWFHKTQDITNNPRTTKSTMS